MAAIDFPASPAMNQQYSQGTTTWQWDGTAWNIVPQMGPLFVGDLPPSNPAAGQQWLRTTNMQLYAWYVDPTSSQWIQVSGPGPAPGIWEPLYSGAVTSFTTWSKVDLGAFAQLRLGIDLAPDNTAGQFKLNFTEDNGATWITGANYTTQVTTSFGTSSGNGQIVNDTTFDMGMNQSIQPTSLSIGLGVEYIIRKFNKPGWTRYAGWGGMYASNGNIFALTEFGTCTRANPCNGIKITATQLSSGFITLEGVRG